MYVIAVNKSQEFLLNVRQLCHIFKMVYDEIHVPKIG